ncbi:hypothetical protein [Aureivirga marina]|uniref:hypothetical protein n=1 Tax=Aureivirga marina TaxID=1182451 RepID=UPI0018CBAE81|nr:hypothetical protein [Aureivirga marina]
MLIFTPDTITTSGTINTMEDTSCGEACSTSCKKMKKKCCKKYKKGKRCKRCPGFDLM